MKRKLTALLLGTLLCMSIDYSVSADKPESANPAGGYCVTDRMEITDGMASFSAGASWPGAAEIRLTATLERETARGWQEVTDGKRTVKLAGSAARLTGRVKTDGTGRYRLRTKVDASGSRGSRSFTRIGKTAEQPKN